MASPDLALRAFLDNHSLWHVDDETFDDALQSTVFIARELDLTTNSMSKPVYIVPLPADKPVPARCLQSPWAVGLVAEDDVVVMRFDALA